MALKLELEQWLHACDAFDRKDYDTALRAFYNMADSAKMHFNIGLILATLDDHERAVAAYRQAISMDPFFAVAYFQMGVSHFLLNDMEAARQDFDLALEKLRGNAMINYQQLGLQFRLYSCEVLFNRGICQLYLGKIDAGLTDLYHAQKSKMTEEHDIINQAVRDRGKGYSVYSIPPGVLYRPPESRLRQLKGMDMFAAMDKLGISQQKQPPQAAAAGTGIKRNNSILLTQQRRAQAAVARYDSNIEAQDPVVVPYPSQSTPYPSSSTSSNRHSRPSASTRRRKDSNDSSLRQRAEGARRIDSGFASTYEDQRYSTTSSSSSCRNSTRSHKTIRYSPPPVPPIPRSQSQYDDLDPDLVDDVYNSLENLSIQEREREKIRERLNSSSSIYDSSDGSDHRRGSDHSSSQPPASPSSPSTVADVGNKIKIKVHYTDTRILLVPSNISFDELLSRIRSKFNGPPSLRLQYKDEDDEMVLMIDEDDLNLARHINRIRNGESGGVERMEIWCID